jgi:hypothetical protein
MQLLLEKAIDDSKSFISYLKEPKKSSIIGLLEQTMPTHSN